MMLVVLMTLALTQVYLLPHELTVRVHWMKGSTVQTQNGALSSTKFTRKCKQRSQPLTLSHSLRKQPTFGDATTGFPTTEV